MHKKSVPYVVQKKILTMSETATECLTPKSMSTCFLWICQTKVVLPRCSIILPCPVRRRHFDSGSQELAEFIYAINEIRV